jgi:hypothetical protein
MWVAIGIILIFGSYAIVNTIMQARFGPAPTAVTDLFLTFFS